MISLWPFVIWEIDLIGRVHKGIGSVKYAVLAINYFTKWIEAKALASITPTKIKEFIYKNIIYWYGVPHTIVSDNRTQFDYDHFKEFWTTSKSKKSSCRSHSLRPMDRSKR